MWNCFLNGKSHHRRYPKALGCGCGRMPEDIGGARRLAFVNTDFHVALLTSDGT